jgi:hypothetical protein
MLVKLNPDGFERGKEGDCNGENFTAGRPNENDVSYFVPPNIMTFEKSTKFSIFLKIASHNIYFNLNKKVV